MTLSSDSVLLLKFGTLQSPDGIATSLILSGCKSLQELSFYVFSQTLTFLDLSGCISLNELDHGATNVYFLNVSGCTGFKELSLAGGTINTLDISGCTNLEVLDCSNNCLSSIDISLCPKLKSLACENNCITQMITIEDKLETFIYDSRYVYDDSGNWQYRFSSGWFDNPQAHTGWYYPGEPESGHHGR